MYNPKPFKIEDELRLKEFIAEYPLAILVCANSSGLEANHIPMYLLDSSDQSNLLRGHIAKANSLWKEIEDSSDVLLIFQGPQAYISPNWYPTKKENGKAVPTWNYASVHVQGTISFIDDSAWKLDMLNTLTNSSERHQAMPWQVSDAPVDFIEKQLGGIVGVEISVSAMRGKSKMSQNQPARNHQGVIEGLSESSAPGTDETAYFMQITSAKAPPRDD